VRIAAVQGRGESFLTAKVEMELEPKPLIPAQQRR